MKQSRIVALVVLAVVLGAAAGLNHFYGFLGSAKTRAPQPGKTAAPGDKGVSVNTAVAEVEDFVNRRRTIGIIEAPATVVVKSRLESLVIEQHVNDGQLVKKGDPLFTLDDLEIRATVARDQAQLAKDEATLTRTKLDLERYKRLATTDATPLQLLDQATAENKIAEATVQADEAQLRSDNLRLNYAQILAPIDGRIGAIRVTPGNLIKANDSTGLATITQFQPIRVAFTLPERDLAGLRKASASSPPAVVRVYTPSATEPLATGVLDFVDSAVDTPSGTIAAKASFGNQNGELWPGMFVDVEIDLDVRPQTVMIPIVAIQAGQQGPFVFVANKEQKVELRKIEQVGIEGNRAAIAYGVAGGERLVVEGQMQLTNGARVTEIPPPSISKTIGLR